MSNKYPEEFYSVPTDKVITRFPPENNNNLHLGHIKATECDFGFAMDSGGECIMRFDDTNPVTEKQEYVDGILEDLKWLGYKPSKITYTSDYFDILYNYAVQLIKQNDAYVCELNGEEISQYRERREDSPYKNRPIAESLKLFEEMKDGKHKENSMTLRMKGDIKNNNPCMWDLIFYRILDTPHYRTGSKWHIYASYDYSHCIVDSIEGITHSLCTKEFQIRRESYFWVLDKLKLRKPLVYEFSRLNIKDGILSKRKIIELVATGKVQGNDDPRLLTIGGLKRRGYTASALRKFCNYKNIGITQNDSEIHIGNLEGILRDELDPITPRRFIVKEPLLMEITNIDTKGNTECTLPDFPNKPKDTTVRKMTLTKNVYIDRNNFREKDDKTYYGLAPDKIVRLKYSDFVKCTHYDRDEKGNVIKLYATLVTPVNPKKIKGILNWVNSDALAIEVREFNGMDASIYQCLGEPNLSADINNGRYQFERYGYYCIDRDTTKNKLVFNRTVELKS